VRNAKKQEEQSTIVDLISTGSTSIWFISNPTAWRTRLQHETGSTAARNKNPEAQSHETRTRKRTGAQRQEPGKEGPLKKEGPVA